MTGSTSMPDVLIVGDIGILLEMELAEFGFNCDLSDTGADAAQRITQKSFPIVIVSTTLQDMTGVDFTRSLLNHVADSRVALYGSGVSDADQAALAATGRVFCVPSSISGRDIGVKLADLVQQGELLNPAATAPTASVPGAPMVPPSATPVAPTVTPPVAAMDAPLSAVAPGATELEQARARLQSENEALQGELEGLRKRSENQVQQIAEFQQQLSEAQRTIDEGQRYVADMNRRFEEASSQYQALERMLEETKQEVDRERGGARKAEQRAEDLQRQIDDDSSASDMLRTRIQGLEEMLGESRRQVQQLEAERTSARTEAEGLRARVAETTTQRAKIEAQLSDMTFDRDEARDEATQLRARLREQEDSADGLEQQVNELRGRNEAHEERIASFEQERAQLKQQLKQLEQELKTTSAEHDAALVQVSDLEGELGLLRDTQDEISALQQQKMQYAAEAAAQRSEFAQLRARVDEQASEAQKFQGELVGKDEMLARRQQEINELETTVKQLRHDLELSASSADDFSVIDEEEVSKELERRTQQFHSMVDALSPFCWGLEKTVEHMEMLGEESSEQHIRQLRLLLNVLKRVAEEVSELKAKEKQEAVHDGASFT